MNTWDYILAGMVIAFVVIINVYVEWKHDKAKQEAEK